MGVELRGFEGRIALVTGGARGMGANHARALAEAGCNVAVLDATKDIDGTYPLSKPEDLEQTVSEIEALDRRALALNADLRDDAAVGEAVQRAVTELGPIDILVNNGGVAAVGPVHELSSTVIDAIIDTNLKGTIHATKHVVPHMIGRRSGRIINIASATTGIGLPQLSPYIASKHGVVGLTESWRPSSPSSRSTSTASAPARSARRTSAAPGWSVVWPG